MTPRPDIFGRLPNGDPVHRVTLENGGVRAAFLTYGATLQDLRVEGVAHPLVIGASTLEPYFGPLMYAGALVGRFSNRLRHGRFEIDGTTYQAEVQADTGHTLHGGPVGVSSKVWSILEMGADHVVMGLELNDGDMGFPGNMSLRAHMSLDEHGALSFDITATSDRATPCSLAHHSYFNLDGTETIADHQLQVSADHFLPVDHALIPLGTKVALDQHAFDFRALKELGAHQIDHNFCLSSKTVPTRPVARLSAARSGIEVGIATNQPGLQVYTGDGLDCSGGIGLEGRTYGARSGIALETQAWPDAPNHPTFPNAILRPDETYHHHVIYKISKRA